MKGGEIMSEVIIPEKIDILEIMRLLPHRYPFILVDRILSLIPDKDIVGLKNVTINEPFFQGHFPTRPVMPGVLILEGMAQVGGVLAFYSEPEKIGNKVLYFVGIDGARFRQPVTPGDQVHYKLELLKKRRGIWQMAALAYVEEKLVAEAELMASFA
jgi:3-hydroxyacyl-[acyl-carrier-protein] dehydratase